MYPKARGRASSLSPNGSPKGARGKRRRKKTAAVTIGAYDRYGRSENDPFTRGYTFSEGVGLTRGQVNPLRGHSTIQDLGITIRGGSPSPNPSDFSDTLPHKSDDVISRHTRTGKSSLTVEDPITSSLNYNSADELSRQTDEKDLFDGDADVQIAELTLKCAKIKQRYLAEKDACTLWKNKVSDLQESVENERKRARNLEKNLARKEEQMLGLAQETSQLEIELRSKTAEPTHQARKSKKDVPMPQDLKMFKEQLKKIQGSKSKLAEFASQMFDKYYAIKVNGSQLSTSNQELRAKNTKQLYQNGELMKEMNELSEQFKLNQAKLENLQATYQQDLDERLKPAEAEIARLRAEIKQVKEQAEGETYALRQRNEALLEEAKCLHMKFDEKERAIQRGDEHSKALAHKLWIYKTRMEQHELTIKRYKCSLKTNAAYNPKTGKRGNLAQSEHKAEDTLEVTLRLFKIPSEQILYVEICSDDTGSAFPDIRRPLTDIVAIRQLFSENGQLGSAFSLILGDQELLLDSWQASDIVKSLSAIISVNNQPPPVESPTEKPRRRSRLSFTRKRKPSAPVPAGPSLRAQRPPRSHSMASSLPVKSNRISITPPSGSFGTPKERPVRKGSSLALCY